MKCFRMLAISNRLSGQGMTDEQKTLHNDKIQIQIVDRQYSDWSSKTIVFFDWFLKVISAWWS